MKIKEGPCYRESCPGPMVYTDGIYICQSCGLGAQEDDYVDWFENGPEVNNDLEDDYDGVPGYDPLYDFEGNYIFCPDCYEADTPLKWHDGVITCPRCGSTFEKEEFPEIEG